MKVVREVVQCKAVGGEVPEVPLEVAVQPEAAEVDPTSSLSPTDILVYSSQRARNTCLSRRTLYPENLSMAKNAFRLTGGVDGTKVEYRVWNPFRSKLAAGILGGVEDIYIAPGKKVLYLGAASGTSVSHVADIVGPVSVAVMVIKTLC